MAKFANSAQFKKPEKWFLQGKALIRMKRISFSWWLENIQWLLDLKRLNSYRKFSKLRDHHKGQRCFIIGNGPSLNVMDLTKLKKEITFGANRIYLIYPKVEFETTYYVSVNKLVIQQFGNDIDKLSSTKFISWYGRNYISFDSSTILIRDPYKSRTNFSFNPAKLIWEGSTVTYVSMQIAFYMGFSKVYLIGVDHSFASVGKPNESVMSTQDDPNHFDSNYFGKGIKWQLPDLESSEKSYRLAKKVFEENDRVIFNATIGGKLDIFPKVDYHSLFD